MLPPDVPVPPPDSFEVPAGGGVGALSQRLRFLADDVLEVRVAEPPPFSYALDPEASWGGASSLHTESEGEHLTLRTPALTVRVARSSGRLSVHTADGRVVQEDAGGVARTGGGVALAKRLRPGERLFGLGDKPVGLDRRGHAFRLWNTDAYKYRRGSDPLYKSIPFLLGVADEGGAPLAYGLFVDSFAPSAFDLGKEEASTLRVEVEDEALTYYVLHANTPLGVLERYARLTGRTPMLPRWALGYHQCRYSYRTEAEVREVARTFRERGIPCDTLYLDIHYMDRYRVFTWDPEAFPDPAGLLADLRADGFTTVAIVDPGVKKDEEDYAPLQAGLAQGLFVTEPDGAPFEGVVWPGSCHFPDFTLPEARRWWGDLHRSLLDDGLDGIWCDMNEPSILAEGPLDRPPGADDMLPQPGTLPDDVRHDVDGHPSSHRRAHNAYGMQMLRATYEGLRRLRPERRPFTITRAAYAGAQRYGTTWTGDNAATWDHLRLAVEQCLSLSVGGMPFCGADVGGFLKVPSGELLARWTQLGAVTPLFRNHSAEETPLQEPWRFGPEVERACRDAIELRYRLLPYLYTAMEEMARTGLPMLRALPLVHPDDEALRGPDAPLGFYVGDSLLTFPVLTRGRRSVDARLPDVPGGWYCFHTGARLRGGEAHRVAAPLGRLPLLVRAGTVLPLGPIVPSTAALASQPLALRVYPREGAFASALYEDAGDGWAHEEGAYYRCTFRAEARRGRLAVTPVVEGGYRPPWGGWTVEVFGRGGWARMGGRPARFQQGGGALRFEGPVGAAFEIT